MSSRVDPAGYVTSSTTWWWMVMPIEWNTRRAECLSLCCGSRSTRSLIPFNSPRVGCPDVEFVVTGVRALGPLDAAAAREAGDHLKQIQGPFTDKPRARAAGV